MEIADIGDAGLDFYQLESGEADRKISELDRRIQEISWNPLRGNTHIKGGAEYDIKTGDGSVYIEVDIEFR